MRPIDLIIVHCSATRCDQDIDAATIRQWHMAKGWRDIGYHYVIKLDGTVEPGRPEEEIGAHAAPFNTASIGICYIGGYGMDGKTANTMTREQQTSLIGLLETLSTKYAHARILGHRDLSPDLNGDGKITPNEWIKECPCFDVRSWCAQRGIDPRG